MIDDKRVRLAAAGEVPTLSAIAISEAVAGFAFGASNSLACYALRKLALAIEQGNVVLQGLTENCELLPDDFVTRRWTMSFTDRVPDSLAPDPAPTKE